MTKKIREHICDEKLFASIFTRYSKVLHNYLYYKFGGGLLYEDKVQEAFIKLWDKCDEVPINKAKSFLFKVATNGVLNEIKHQKVVMNYKNTKPKNYTAEHPQFILEEKEYLEKYKKALEKLTDGQREAFLLNREEGKRFKEIASFLNISVKAVEKRIYGAVKKLREEIKEIR